MSKLEQKEVLQVKEEKRLGTYRARIAKKVEELKAVQAQQVERREELKRCAARLAQAEQENTAQAKNLAIKAAQADTMIEKLQAWLGRDDLLNTARHDGEKIKREFGDGLG